MIARAITPLLLARYSSLHSKTLPNNLLKTILTLGLWLVEHVGAEGMGGGGQGRHYVHALGALLPILQECL